MTVDDLATVENICDLGEPDADDDVSSASKPWKTPNAIAGPPTRRPLRAATIFGVLVVAVLVGLTGWLGARVNEARTDADTRALLLQAARQGALNLTTIDYDTVESDIRRIEDSTTGTFKDDFQQRAEPFVDVVKQAQATSVGTITEAGVESVDGDLAEVLVAVSVTTSNAGGGDQQPRAWRMRIAVQRVGDAAKVSNVEFVA